jgi:hypothetical protein
MGSRLVASLLVLVLSWSAVGTIEGLPRLAQHFPNQLAVLSLSGSTEDGHTGSVEDHHLDDLPGQPVSDTPLDSSGLPHAEPTLRLGNDGALRRPAAPSVLRAAPCLAGPLRPPCGAERLA